MMREGYNLCVQITDKASFFSDLTKKGDILQGKDWRFKLLYEFTSF